jgi:UDP-N-acetyl-D-mannosaminuronic acid dehydrogenase
LKEHIVDLLLMSDASILDAIRAMESKPRDGHGKQAVHRPAGIVLVIKNDNTLMGVVTDGDIRRALLSGINLDDPIEQVMTRDPIVVRKDEVTLNNYSDIIQYIHRSGRMMDPSHGKVIVLNSDDQVEDIISLFDLLKTQSVRAQTICVVGMGYVGLTLAIALAESGLMVYGVEAKTEIRESLQSGNVHFHETGLRRAFLTNLNERLFIGSSVLDTQADIYLICVGTPIDENAEPVLRDVESAAESVGTVLKRGDLVGLRSTVPIGTTRNIVLPLLERSSGLVGGQDFDLVFTPERTVAGKALYELRTLPQVLGSLNESGLERASSLYRELTPSIVTVSSLEEAELVKLLNNSFRDHVFAFSNEVSQICHQWGLDTHRVIRAANEGYPRNPVPLPSPGVGGICLNKDPHLFVASARSANYIPKIIGQSRIVNESMLDYLYKKIHYFLSISGKNLKTANIFIVGFAFKGEPETSDMRCSTTLDMAKLLLKDVEQLRGFDPVIPTFTLDEIPGVKSCSIEQGFQEADCIVIMNNHRSYPDWPINQLLDLSKKPVLFLDSWRMFEPSDICKAEDIVFSSLGGDYMYDQTKGSIVETFAYRDEIKT